MPYRADVDEGPSEEDLARFSDDTGFCPECGHRVLDDADVCTACGAWITGDVAPHPPLRSELERRMLIIVVGVLILGLTGWWLIF
ncbi:MAG: zinc-ribbon domain-containing protein [Phycisphaerales bacterium]